MEDTMRHRTARVVAGVSERSSHDGPVLIAGSEAALRGVPLRLVQVPESGLAADGQMLERSRERVTNRYPDVVVETCAVDGDPAEVLVDESIRADLTVIGHRVGNPLVGLSAGSVCARVTARGHGPILVARGTTPDVAGGPVVLGVDADRPHRAAIDFAFAEAALRDVPLRVVYVWSIEPSSGLFADPGINFDEAGEQATCRLAEALAGWAGQWPDVKVERVAEHCLDAPTAMRDASTSAGLVVVGPHQRPDFRHWTVGSVAKTLVHHSSCPVAVVHPDAR
jgi:nucleotide-binding universal stress UspA family protein